MAALTVIAKLKAKPGTEDQLYEACRRLIAQPGVVASAGPRPAGTAEGLGR